MATVVVGCMCVCMVEGTSIMQIQPKGNLLHKTIFTGCKHTVTMVTVLIRYEVVQNLMLIHNHYQVTALPGVINCCHGKH